MSAARAAILALLDERDAGTTICPSEAARRLHSEEWRTQMPAIHHAVDRLMDERRITLSWKGQGMSARRGPYRIGKPAP